MSQTNQRGKVSHRFGWAVVLGAGLVALVLGVACGPAATATLTPTPPKPTATPTRPSPTATPLPNSSAQLAPPEMVHAAYVDLNANISDLKSRITQWEGGDEGGLNIAKEKVDRIKMVVGHTTWPKALTVPVGKISSAMGPIESALLAKDLAATKAAMAGMGEAPHDLTHEVYDEWVPAHKQHGLGAMSPHVAYLDLNANMADLRDRITRWEGGDESSLNIAKEKAERIEALLHAMTWPAPMEEVIEEIEQTVDRAATALTAKDTAAAKQAIAGLGETSDGLAHEFYDEWMAGTKGVSDAPCVHASYLDLTANVNDLKARVTAWEGGDTASLEIAEEKVERINALLGHTTWPEATMATATGKIRDAIGSIQAALEAKDPAAAKQAIAAWGEAPHDLTHGFYDKWMAGMMAR